MLLTHISSENQKVRTFTDSLGRILIHVSDLCKPLGFSNPSKAIEDNDLRHLTQKLSDGTKGYPALWITEAGSYLLMFEAQSLEAKNFKIWLATEVLPSIRKTGSYTATEADQQHFAPFGLKINLQAIYSSLEKAIVSEMSHEDINARVNALNALLEIDKRETKVSKATEGLQAHITYILNYLAKQSQPVILNKIRGTRYFKDKKIGSSVVKGLLDELVLMGKVEFLPGVGYQVVRVKS